MNYESFEAVIGLEVHIELKTKTKMFCACPTDFGASPNTHICPVCMGLPGAMPVMNKKAVELAARAGICTNCSISGYSRMARKNYFYPDLPKAYQISQDGQPLCKGGWLDIEVGEGKKRICIERIHMEEDAGKLLHGENGETMIDFNRCGVPLIEIVTKPDIRNADEAKAFLQKLRSIMMYAGVSECRMNEGNLRCDVNLSVRRRGDSTLGVRCEMKNLNSFQFVQKAIESEYKRQCDVILSGGTVKQETRRYDEKAQKSFSMRTKESLADYRFFADPDLLPIILSSEKISEIANSMPAMPYERKIRYQEIFGITADDAETLISSPETAEYFESCAAVSRYPKICANLIISEIMGIKSSEEYIGKIAPAHLAALSELMGDRKINSATAKLLIRDMWLIDHDPAERVEREGLQQIRDEVRIRIWARQAIAENPKSVSDYIKGKAAAAKAIIGKTMAKSGGRADPLVVGDVVVSELEKELPTAQ